MDLITSVLVGNIAAEHIYILWLEMSALPAIIVLANILIKTRAI